ncbi:sphingosine kinase 2-like isoform X2 [Phragmites australis]|uniref:sphingosine kinase 2-like isoform X2 n=1 Tax=Phragmites australis TaxID=29695 RepID=UPI002D772EA6|nr:sphingosine kinase 2-like isoform X2 [Phragmites australis]
MEDHATANVRVDGAPAEATLGGGLLRWRGAAGCRGAADRSLSLEGDVLGVEARGKEVVVRAFVAASAGGKRCRRDFVFEMADGEGAAAALGERLGRCLDSFGRPKRLFIFVNPFGGKKCAKKIYETEIRPLFEAVGVSITMQETQYQGHAREVASSLDLAKYDGIVCVSGDGVLVEVVNGILQRTDWEEAIMMPIGVVPAGTGNGMAKSLLHAASETYSVSNAVFAIIKGHTQSLDVCTILQGEKKFFSVLLMTWGLVADIDIESEKYRWMGSARFDFYAVLRIMNLRKYCGSIQFVPAPGYEAYGEPVEQVDNCIVECQEQNGKCHLSSYPGPSDGFKGSDWRFVHGPFVAVWINNVPWAAEDIMAAPEAKFSDGYMDAVIVRDCPKADLLALLMKMSDGSYVKSPYVTYLKVRSFQLSPGQLVENPKRGGIIDVDGEVIARGEGTYGKNQHQDVMAYGPPIQLTVHQALATVYCPSKLR